MKKRKGYHVKSKYLLAILTIVCISLISLTVTETVSITPIREAAGVLIVPMQSGINKIGDWINGQHIGRKSARELAEENEQLKTRISELEEQNTVLTQNEQELNDLRALYNLDQGYTGYDKVAASVIAKDTGNWFNSFTIDKGSDDGITVDMNVISAGGLVGIVTAVGTNWATVRSIIDDGNSISGMILSTSDPCIVNGNMDLMEEDKMSFGNLTTDADITPGEQIVTSNISDKYLPGILIGYIDSIEDDSNHLAKTGYLIPAVDFHNIQTVLVIKQVKESGAQ
ncbi:MAG: rod shape-determining protein MreC [Eubacterium sp.]|nr:rod shape-determining protein MreC [Eubacterium sp.]